MQKSSIRRIFFIRGYVTFSYLSINEDDMIIEPLVLGLSTGSVCSLHCIPSAVPYLASGQLERKPYNSKVLLFFCGRLLSYLAVGMVLGFLGRFTMEQVGPVFYKWISVCGNLLVGGLLLISGILYHLRKKSCFIEKSEKKEKYSAFLLGIFTGLNLCPPFVAATAGAFSQSGPLQGALYFLLFFAGTSLYLLPLFALGFLKKYTRQINILCRIVLVLMGFYFLAKGVLLI